METRSKRARRLNPNGGQPKSNKESIQKEAGKIMVTHPLLVSVILKTLFNFLPLSDLKSCRLVHSMWNELCTPVAARLSAPITFGYVSFQDPMKKIEKFMGCFKTCRNALMPCSKINIIKFPQAPRNLIKRTEISAMFYKLLVNSGPIWKEMEIDLANEALFQFATEENLPEIGFPNLRKLTASLEFFDDPSKIHVYRWTTTFLVNVLNNAPKLDSLRFEYIWNNESTFAFIKTLLGTKQFGRITTLELCGKLEKRLLQLFKDKGLGLTCLVLNLEMESSDDLDGAFVKGWLEMLDKLEVLYLQGYSKTFIQNIPRMEKIKQLSICVENDDCNAIGWLEEGLCFSKKLPALEKLELSCMSMKMLDNIFGFNVEPFEGEMELELTLDDEDRQKWKDMIVKIARAFPRMTKLTISPRMGRGMVKFIKEQMKELNEVCFPY